MTDVLIHVEAPHFNAGVVIRDGRVVKAAPILKWSMGWERDRLSAYFKRKGWRAYTTTPKVTPDV